MNNEALKKLQEKYLNDPIIHGILGQMQSIYLNAVPIGMNTDGFIYSDNVNNMIAELKKQLNNYTSIKYDDLLNDL